MIGSTSSSRLVRSGFTFSSWVISIVEMLTPSFCAIQFAVRIRVMVMSPLDSPESERVARQYATPASLSRRVTTILLLLKVGSFTSKYVKVGGAWSNVETRPAKLAKATAACSVIFMGSTGATKLGEFCAALAWERKNHVAAKLLPIILP